MKTVLLLLFSITVVSQQVKAQNDTSFHFVDYVPDRFIKQAGDTMFVDLDNDGQSDYKFYLVWGSAYNYDHLGSCAFNNKLARLDTTDSRLLTDSSISYYYTGGTVVFPTKKFLVCRIEKGSDLFYGWILYYGAFPSNTEKNYLYIDKYAFCKIPNYGIRVGQTSREQSTRLTDVTKNEFAIELVAGEKGLAILAPKGIQKVEVYDVLGKRVYEGNGNKLPIHELPKLTKMSIHVIRVELEDGATVSKKVVLD